MALLLSPYNWAMKSGELTENSSALKEISYFHILHSSTITISPSPFS